MMKAPVAVPASYKSLVEAKKVRILAIAAEARSPLYPDLPTFRENGVDLAIGAFHGVFAPKGTPAPIIERVADALEKTLAARGVVGALALVVLGGYVVWEAAHLHFGTLQRPDSGFFPLILAVLLTASAGLVAAGAWEDGAAAAMTRPRGTGRLIAAILGLIVYVFVLDPAGYVLSTSAVMLLFTRGLERLSWRAPVLGPPPGRPARASPFPWRCRAPPPGPPPCFWGRRTAPPPR